MKIIRIPLKPYSHYHFGEFKIDSSVALSSTSHFFHSDTLFSALVNTYADQIGNADDFVLKFIEGRIQISSMLYYLKNQNRAVYFLPKPGFIDLYGPRDGKHKIRGKVNMVSQGVWEEGFDTEAWTESDRYCFIQNKEIVLLKEEYDDLGLSDKMSVYTIVDIPKNPIRKTEENNSGNESDSGSIYYQTDVEITPIKDIETGFYFLYDYENPSDNEMLKKVIGLLIWSGFGGERNNMGRTQTLYEISDQFTIQLKEQVGYKKGLTNLSLLIPKDKEELGKIEFMQTILRGGRKTEGSQRKVIRMIKEGALLTDPIVEGAVAEINGALNETKALRYGRAFNIPLQYKTQL